MFNFEGSCDIYAQICQCLEAWVTDDPEVLAAFIEEAHQQYDALEQCLGQLTQNVIDLESDRFLGDQAFWLHIMTLLTSLRGQVSTCSALFHRKRGSRDHPVPIIWLTTHMGYSISLLCMQQALDKVGMFMLAHLAKQPSNHEGALYQQHRIGGELRRILQSAQQSIAQARHELENAKASQMKLLGVLELDHAPALQRSRENAIIAFREKPMPPEKVY